MNTLLVVDGNSLLNRAFYGVKPLTTRDGRNTNAIFGFIRILYKQLCELQPTHTAIAFDLKAPTFRHKAYAYYKANRKGMPAELAEQLAPAKKAAALLGFTVLEKEGYEADDILGTLAAQADETLRVFLMTGDRDSYQLISEKANVLYVSTKETSVFDIARIAETYNGLSPRQLIEVKSLMGDTSDNIPGVPGVGEKTAVELVVRYGSLDGVYAALESGDASIKGALRTKLETGKTSAYESRFLAEICQTVPLDATLDALKNPGTDKAGLYDFCKDYELNSIITQLDLAASDAPDAPLTAVPARSLAFREENSASAVGTGRFYAYLDSAEKTLYVAQDGSEPVMRLAADADTVKALFADRRDDAVVHNVKELCLYADSLGVTVDGCAFDVLLASYVLDPAKVLTADGLCLYADEPGVDDSDPVQKGILCALAVRKAYAAFCPLIAACGMEKLLYEIEIPSSVVLADMEKVGFKLNTERVRAFAEKLDERLEERRRAIYEYAGGEFNVNSTKQLADVLFERLGLPYVKKTKNGYSTDAETLEHLRPYHPIIDALLEYRTVSKLRSTYTDALIAAADENGRIHTCFKQAFTLTGRLSSAEPNLQNIPIRTEEGRELRKFFEASDDGHILIDADYSQIELRLMAALSGDENMIGAYREGRDIHTSTAASVFGVPESDVTPEQRKQAKAVNFGILYGISDFSLAGDLHVSRKEAAAYIAAYFANFPRVKGYLENVIASAREKGYSETLFGRRRYIPELTAKNKNLQSFGERVAMNAPIQGTAADIIKIAMVRVWRRLKEERLDARLVLQVHDELIVDASRADEARAKAVLREEMAKAAELSVALDVSAGSGFTWYEAHD